MLVVGTMLSFNLFILITGLSHLSINIDVPWFRIKFQFNELFGDFSTIFSTTTTHFTWLKVFQDTFRNFLEYIHGFVLLVSRDTLIHGALGVESRVELLQAGSRTSDVLAPFRLGVSCRWVICYKTTTFRV